MNKSASKPKIKGHATTADTKVYRFKEQFKAAMLKASQTPKVSLEETVKELKVEGIE